MAIGAGARALADPTTAVGNNAVATGNNAVALGANTLASGNNSVALGQGSVASRDNSVSVGNAAAGLTRGITNVSAGAIAPTSTDAINGAQLYQTNTGLSQVAASVAGTNARVSSLTQEMSETRTESRRGVAAAMAMSDAPMPSEPGRTSWSTNVANYRSESAVGASLAHRLPTTIPLAVTVGVGASSNSAGVRVGLKGEF